MLKAFVKITIISALISSSLYSGKVKILGRVFKKVVNYTVEATINDLSKGEQSKIVNYYKKITTSSGTTVAKDNTRIKNNKKILEFTANGITIVVKYPVSVNKGEKFFIEAKMINDFKDANMGGLTLSFPQYQTLDGAIVEKRFDSVKAYTPPQKMYSATLKRAIRIKYFVIEGWEHKWFKDTSRFIKLKLTAPDDSDKLLVNVRGVLVFKSKNRKYEVVNPTDKNAIHIDQQGFYVKQIAIELK